ncbi:hypothetical protein C9424_10430 [Arthrobacter sp. H-02-3]|nr:hypothetical protein C9424_10430 [Arthrobacter sp. H-02-3]
MVVGCMALMTACSGTLANDGRAVPSQETSSGPAVPQHPSSDVPDHFQTVSGLGVNANVHSWDNGRLRPAIDMIADLGEVNWRVIIDKADWVTDRDPSDPATIDWARYTPIYEHGKMADLWNTIEYISSKPGQQVMVNVMGGVPQWMGGDHINASDEDQWVRMIASMVAYGRNVRKLDFTLLSPMNETDWNGIEGPKVGPEQYVRLLHKLVVRLDGLGLGNMRLVGPDTASAPKASSEYLQALDADPLVMSRMAHFGIHSYDGSSGGAAEALAKSSRPVLDYWVTEFSGPCPGCDTGSPNPADWSSAAQTASLAIKLLQEGAAGLMQYDAWDGYYEHHESTGYWGLLAYDPDKRTYSPRKSYYVLRQLIRYVPRNSVRIGASSGDESVEVVAFQDPASGRVSVFGRNNSDSAVKVTVRLPGLSGSVHLSMFSTDPERDMAAADGALLAGGIANLTVGPNSVFTLTGSAPKS